MDTTVKMIKKDSAGNIIKAADVHPNEVRGFQQAGWIIDKTASKAMPQVATPENSKPATMAPKAPVTPAPNTTVKASATAAPVQPAAKAVAVPRKPGRPPKRARS